MNNKYIKPLTLVVAFLILGLVTVASYAYFVAGVQGNDNAFDTVITTGDLVLKYNEYDTNGISLNEAIPGNSISKYFEVENVGSVETTYDVYLSEILNTFVDQNDLVYTVEPVVEELGPGVSECYNLNERVVPASSGEESKIISSCHLYPRQVHSYRLRITFKDDDTNQDDNQGKIFSAKLSINQYNEFMYLGQSMVALKNNGATDLEYDGTDTLGELGTEDNNLRYIGHDPNNYVYFNCDTTNIDEMDNSTCEFWKIIGLFNNIEDENGNIVSRVKIVRRQILGDYSWDSSVSTSNNGSGINQWGESTYEDGTPYEGADIMRELNTDYLDNITIGTDGKWYNRSNLGKTYSMPYEYLFTETQSMIETVKWNTGTTPTSTNVPFSSSINYSALKTSDYYVYERGNETGKHCNTSYSYCSDTVNRTTIWTGKVGLIYPSDYGYSTSGDQDLDRNACLNISPLLWGPYSDDNADCYENAWLSDESSYYSITPAYSGAAWGAYVIDREFSYQPSSELAGIRPTVYLKNNIAIAAGDGSESNPYKLVMN